MPAAMSAAAIQNGVDVGSPKARIATEAPMNGAVEKYAPVRAEPKPRRASTNNTKLAP